MTRVDVERIELQPLIRRLPAYGFVARNPGVANQLPIRAHRPPSGVKIRPKPSASVDGNRAVSDESGMATGVTGIDLMQITVVHGHRERNGPNPKPVVRA